MGTAPTASDERPLRKDAERNRQRILGAARELFAEAGLDATLDAVAERAGVGVGTVYRRFPDKEALIDALFEERIDEVLAIAESALAMDDPWAGIQRFFEASLAVHVHDRGFKEVIFCSARGRDHVAQARDRIKPVVVALVERAQASGDLRPDLDVTDIPLIQLMLTAVMEYTDDIDPAVWRRCLGLLLDGMRAGNARTPLVSSPLSDDQLDVAMARGLRPAPRR
jgi:AcrR family transcriptional regulator